MVFSSHIFLFYFLPLVLLVYHNLPYRWRNLCLAVLSYVFYGWWQPWFIALMLFTTLVNYAAGRVISSPRSGRGRRTAALVVACCGSLGVLGFFKYALFAADSVNRLLALVGAEALPVFRVVLPIGISFYTFQALSYTVDLYRGDARPAESFIDFLCFVALFPQLIAGPILRYHTVADQLRRRDYTLGRFSSGAAVFILGLAKKVLLANPLGRAADAAFAAGTPCTADAWFGLVAFAFQIYFDFCGYSDMAVGLGRMLGFEFPRNFNAPYRAESVTDLWRRWHISLSTFLRDYLYIPLGGNRKGTGRTYVNLAVVMLLGGLWHGAKWTFVLWGAYHGLLLALERARGKRSVYARLPRAIRVGATFALMLLSWVLFRAEDLPSAGRYFGALFGWATASPGAALLAAELYTPTHLAIVALCAVLVFQPVQAFDWARRPVTWPRAAALLALFLLAVLVMFTQAFNPFLYFQF